MELNKIKINESVVVAKSNDHVIEGFKKIIENAKHGLEELKDGKFDNALTAAGAIVIQSKDLQAAMKMRAKN